MGKNRLCTDLDKKNVKRYLNDFQFRQNESLVTFKYYTSRIWIDYLKHIFLVKYKKKLLKIIEICVTSSGSFAGPAAKFITFPLAIFLTKKKTNSFPWTLLKLTLTLVRQLVIATEDLFTTRAAYFYQSKALNVLIQFRSPSRWKSEWIFFFFFSGICIYLIRLSWKVPTTHRQEKLKIS